jgi:splicing factor 3A subunit 3
VQSDSPIQQVVKEHQPVDVSAVPNAAALEKLGLERLKAELSRHGLKAGGSLAERAARLFLLADTPLAQLDRKHFAPAGKK